MQSFSRCGALSPAVEDHHPEVDNSSGNAVSSLVSWNFASTTVINWWKSWLAFLLVRVNLLRYQWKQKLFSYVLQNWQRRALAKIGLTRRQTYMELDTGLGKARTLASKQSWLACSAKGLSSSGHLCLSNPQFRQSGCCLQWWRSSND